jgi:hypothetical protein
MRLERKGTERALGIEVAVASKTAKVASMSATVMHIDLEAEAGPTATQEEAELSEVATPRKRARAVGAQALERMADGTYSWHVLKEQDVPNALEEVAMKLSTMLAVLELANTRETSEQVAERCFRQARAGTFTWTRQWFAFIELNAEIVFAMRGQASGRVQNRSLEGRC